MAGAAKTAVPEGDSPAGDKAGAAPANGKSRKLMMIGALVAILALIGGGAYYLGTRKAHSDDSAVEEKSSAKSGEKNKDGGKEKSKEKDKGPHRAMTYLPLETFTVNLRHADQERYLQVTINLEVVDSVTADALKAQMPSVRNRVLLLLSSQDAEKLMTREGKEKLSGDIADELRKSLDGPGPNKGLEQALFSHFVIQ